MATTTDYREELARRAGEKSPGARVRRPRGESAPALSEEDDGLLDEAHAAVRARLDDLVGGQPLEE